MKCLLVVPPGFPDYSAVVARAKRNEGGFHRIEASAFTRNLLSRFEAVEPTIITNASSRDDKILRQKNSVIVLADTPSTDDMR